MNIESGCESSYLIGASLNVTVGLSHYEATFIG